MLFDYIQSLGHQALSALQRLQTRVVQARDARGLYPPAGGAGLKPARSLHEGERAAFGQFMAVG